MCGKIRNNFYVCEKIRNNFYVCGKIRNNFYVCGKIRNNFYVCEKIRNNFYVCEKIRNNFYVCEKIRNNLRNNKTRELDFLCDPSDPTNTSPRPKRPRDQHVPATNTSPRPTRPRDQTVFLNLSRRILKKNILKYTIFQNRFVKDIEHITNIPFKILVSTFGQFKSCTELA